VRAGARLSLQLLPERPVMPLAMIDQFLAPYSSISCVSSSSSCAVPAGPGLRGRWRAAGQHRIVEASFFRTSGVHAPFLKSSWLLPMLLRLLAVARPRPRRERPEAMCVGTGRPRQNWWSLKREMASMASCRQSFSSTSPACFRACFLASQGVDRPGLV
jgi:hypothetical protein